MPLKDALVGSHAFLFLTIKQFKDGVMQRSEETDANGASLAKKTNDCAQHFQNISERKRSSAGPYALQIKAVFSPPYQN